MKVTYFASSTVLVEADGVSILMDPWLEDGEYYGSWAHFPPINVDYSRFDNVDYIYISHIHPDHLSPKTLAKLNKSIPVLIHSYDAKFLKRNIENAGFRVEEILHGTSRKLTENLTITIFAADDCDPELCGAYFKCAPLIGRAGSTQIDSLCVVKHGDEVLVNTNDCPYGLSRVLMPKIMDRFGHVDLLLTGYAGAGPYPQCFTNLNEREQLKAANAKKLQFLRQGADYIKSLSPRYVLPFAGQYTLAGSLVELNDLRGVPSLTEAREYFANDSGTNSTQVVLLNRGGSLDITSGHIDNPYVPVSEEEEANFREAVLSKRIFDFELDPDPTEDELIALAYQAGKRVEWKRHELGIVTETRVYVQLTSTKFARVSLSGAAVEIVNGIAEEETPYVVFTVQPKLLKRILSGPRFAHWNNATIGSHVKFHRVPDVYENNVYEVMNYFHA